MLLTQRQKQFDINTVTVCKQIISFCRYDYLMFTDAAGCQMKFDQRVGTNKWPIQVQFTGPHVHFLFHSDNSNTDWGYKFKVSYM